MDCLVILESHTLVINGTVSKYTKHCILYRVVIQCAQNSERFTNMSQTGSAVVIYLELL
jgi:hypothetical protein